jgi:hypothetical protein
LISRDGPPVVFGHCDEPIAAYGTGG